MSVQKVVIFGIFVVFSVNCLPLPEYGFSSEEQNGLGDKEYRGYSGIRMTPSVEKEFFVFNNKLSWAEAKDVCRYWGMQLASPETETEMIMLKNYIRDNNLVPADQYSGYWVNGKRDSSNVPFTWQYTGNLVRSFSWLPGEPNYFNGEDCIEFKNHAGSLGLNNLYCETPRGYICERALPEESLKNKRIDLKDKIHEENVKYIFQDLSNQMLSESDFLKGGHSVSSTSDESDSVSIAIGKTYSVPSSTDNIDSGSSPEISDYWRMTPERSISLPVSDYDYAYDYYSQPIDDLMK